MNTLRVSKYNVDFVKKDLFDEAAVVFYTTVNGA